MSGLQASLEQIARVTHEANRAWCEANGDTSQVPWDQAPDWQRDSAIIGARAAIRGATPEQLHESWLQHKTAEGWVHGPVKDADARIHPCMVPYDQLPPEQRIKDGIFHGVVSAFVDAMFSPTPVFSRDECVFRYCPHPEHCQDACVNRPRARPAR